MRKIIMMVVNLFRSIRGRLATAILKWRAAECGTHVGAARVPHIGGEVTLRIGNHASFNGFTATGWGGGKNR